MPDAVSGDVRAETVSAKKVLLYSACTTTHASFVLVVRTRAEANLTFSP
jgi:hypothetical protein